MIYRTGRGIIAGAIIGSWLFSPGVLCNINQQQKLTATDGEMGEFFGVRTVMTNSTIIITAYEDTVNGNDNQGSAYTYTQDGAGWAFHQQLFSDDGAAEDYFGNAASTYAVYLAIGSYRSDVNENEDQGAVYLYEQNENNFLFSQVEKFTIEDGEPNDMFGFSVAVSDTTLVGGAPARDNGGNANQGVAYVFEFSMFEFEWQLVATLTNNDGKENGAFGLSLSVCAYAIIAGSNLADSGGDQNVGAAYLFKQDPSNNNDWTQYQKIIADDGAVADNFAESLVVSSDCKKLLIGAFADDANGKSDEGSAYYFTLSDTFDSYTQQQRINPNNGSAAEYFGYSVAMTTTFGSDIDDNRFVIGAIGYMAGDSEGVGSAYVFEAKESGVYRQVEQLLASDGMASDDFGLNVACSYNVIVVGAPGDDVLGSVDQGSAYIYDSSAAPPTPEPTVAPTPEPSNSGKGSGSGDDDSGLNDGETAAVVIVVLVVAGVLAAVGFRQYKKKESDGGNAPESGYQSMDKTVLLTQSRSV